MSFLLYFYIYFRAGKPTSVDGVIGHNAQGVAEEVSR